MNTATRHPSPGPAKATRQPSLAEYRQRAAAHDSTCGPTWTIRKRTIAQLPLQPGQWVLAVACGTGLSLQLLRRPVGGAPSELRRPWDRIAPRLGDWHFEPTQWGAPHTLRAAVAA